MSLDRRRRAFILLLMFIPYLSGGENILKSTQLVVTALRYIGPMQSVFS